MHFSIWRKSCLFLFSPLHFNSSFSYNSNSFLECWLMYFQSPLVFYCYFVQVQFFTDQVMYTFSEKGLFYLFHFYPIISTYHCKLSLVPVFTHLAEQVVWTNIHMQFHAFLFFLVGTFFASKLSLVKCILLILEWTFLSSKVSCHVLQSMAFRLHAYSWCFGISWLIQNEYLHVTILILLFFC